jgi:hypothetical protein
MMLDRPATSSTLVTVASGQLFSTSLIPTAIGNATKIFDVDSSATDTAIGGAYIDEITLRYSKDINLYIDAKAGTAATYTINNGSGGAGTILTVTLANHNLKVGQRIYLDFTTGVGVDDTYAVTSITPTTFVAASTSLNTSGNVTIYPPTDICFYLVKVGTITNTNQFFPLFVANIESIETAQYCSLTLKELLPLINNPAAHAGANFSSETSPTVAPKLRGLILPTGSALYASISGATSLTNGFYINILGGYY